MNIYGVMVTRNEEDRYLNSVLTSISDVVDDLIVIDDGSTDNTVKMVESFGYRCTHLNTEDESLFLKNEGLLRQISLETLKARRHPTINDWVLCLDADEFISSNHPKEELILRAASAEIHHNTTSYEFPVAEVFKLVNSQPYVRIDGFWNDIWANRFFKWSNEAPYIVPDTLGSGSVPEYARPMTTRVDSPTILHYGYAREEDRVKKYARYFGTPGHNSRHIDSILRSPTLIKWEGERMTLSDY